MPAVKLFLCYLTLVVALNIAKGAPQSKLDISIDSKYGTFRIYLSKQLWFNGGPVAVHNQGHWLSTDQGTLAFQNYSISQGEDVWGRFTSTEIHWTTPDKSYNFNTITKEYEEEPILVFEQHFRDGVTDGAIDGVSSETMSIFPSLLLEHLGLERGYLTYSGNQDARVSVDVWGPDTVLPKGDEGGLPLVIFDSELDNTVVISPLTGFMAASQSIWKPSNADSPAVGLGIMSSVETIPQDYVYKSVMVAGENVTGTMEKWGKLLQKLYNKGDFFRKNDFAINYLGYWTDNGACYYYNTGQYKDYEEALTAVYHDSLDHALPFRYVQIDSWWYYKGVNGGVKNWTAMREVFPSGVRGLYRNTNGWPIVAHNRFWSSNTDYAKQNGGQFNFIIDGGYALPNDSNFWLDLLSHAQEEWHLTVYEQDWLDNEFAGLKELETDLFLGRRWLTQMGDAAAILGMTIQYCMSWPRHLMQSIEIPAVTQIRVSGDYHPGNSQWMIGDTSILAHALGLAPFKDTFHSVVHEEDYTKCRFTDPEPAPALQAYVSALSGGPVGPSDTVGQANRTLVMATCMSDGRLLKPTRPAMSVDSSFVYRAFKKNGPDGEVYVAYTEVSSWTWYYVLAANLKKPYNFTTEELPLNSVSPPVAGSTGIPYSLAVRYTLSGAVVEAMHFTEFSEIELQPGEAKDFQYWVIAPVMFPTFFVYLGELNKIIPVSETRITGISWSDDYEEYLLYLKGPQFEVIVVYLTMIGDPERLFPVQCTFGFTGVAVMHVPYRGDLVCITA